MDDPSYAHHGSSRSLFALLALVVILFLTLGKPFLGNVGIPYSTPGGHAIWKFHPATYVTLLTLLVAMFRYGGPLGFLVHRFRDQRAVMTYLVIVTLIAMILYLRNGPGGLAYMVDALMVPALVALIVPDLSPANRARIFTLIMVLVLANGVLAIGEAVVRTHLIEPEFDFTSPFRATALLGHPLNNALISAPVVLFALAFGRLPAMRLIAVLVLVAALLAFGGRAAIALTAVLLLTMVAVHTGGRLHRGTMPLRDLIALPLMLLFLPLAVSGLWFTTNLAERLQAKLFFDPSAHTRVNVFQVFDYMTPSELVLGVSSRAVVDFTEFVPNSETLENFWVFLILQMGLVMFIPFVLGLIGFIAYVFRNTSLAGRFALVLFMLVASTNNSLASKTPALAIVVLLALGGLSYERRLAARRATIRGDELALGVT